MLALLGACLATGCATSKYPEDALRLTESPLDIRSMQTRTYEVSSEAVILAASVGVLQDMEFNIDEVERPLGVLTAVTGVVVLFFFVFPGPILDGAEAAAQAFFITGE